MKFRPQYAIMNIAIEIVFVIIELVKIATWGHVGKMWGIWLAMKALTIPAEYDEE